MSEQVVTLRLKYRKGYSYKSQKSKSSNSGNSNKKKVNKANPQKPLPGKKVMWLDFSGVPKFCAGTGTRLPSRGMVVFHDGKYYRDYSAIGA